MMGFPAEVGGGRERRANGMKAMRMITACVAVALWSGVAAADVPLDDDDDGGGEGGCECGVAGEGGRLGAVLAGVVGAAALAARRQRREQERK